MTNINRIMYYVLYNNIIIENEEFYIKCYFKNNKLTQNQKDECMQFRFSRFDKWYLKIHYSLISMYVNLYEIIESYNGNYIYIYCVKNKQIVILKIWNYHYVNSILYIIIVEII